MPSDDLRKRFDALLAGYLTVEAARECVEIIRAFAGDDEVAHGMEDALREVVLEFVAQGRPIEIRHADKLTELAQVALSTSQIEFSRWCA